MSGSHSFGAFLVFHLSTKCNLECVYCNVDAGPGGFRPVLDPQILEKWLQAFASLGPAEIGIQLHGGEPLVVDPPVEIFAAIARNTLARFPGTKLTDLGVQSNGVALDESRADSLARAGVRINISIDGPAWIHDRQRVTVSGRGSHQEAVLAHHRLRARGINAPVIAVVSQPPDVSPALQFFLDDGFRAARMNPMRPEGRAASLEKWDDEAFMRDMALEYFRAAKLISDHNTRCPDARFVEDNLANMMESLVGNSKESEMLHWTFLIDDRGDLWAHPGGYGVDPLHLTRGEVPNVDVLRRALGLDTDVVLGLRQLRARLFTACAGCRTPDFCISFHGLTNHAGSRHPVCVWRSELMNHLDDWLREDPEAARRITASNE